MSGILYVCPSPLIDTVDSNVIKCSLPLQVIEVIIRTNFFAVENAKTARRVIKQCSLAAPHITGRPIQDRELVEIKQASPTLLDTLVRRVKSGKDLGLLSDCGMPCIADPGNTLVQKAHQNGVPITTLAGPSSIPMALAASGFQGQRFRFHGYLPVHSAQRKQKLLALEAESKLWDETQLFIETPYRNQQLWQDFAVLSRRTQVLAALALTHVSEKIIVCFAHEHTQFCLPNNLPGIFGLYVR